MSPVDPIRTQELLTEVERFKSWAASYPIGERGGEWECDYEDWNRLYAAVLGFVDRKPFPLWSAEELTAVLYALARDNEMEHLSRQMAERGGDLLLDLSEASVRVGEAEARWQLATQLEHAGANSARQDQVLLKLARDENEYVRRRSLHVLARLGSPMTEELALEAWSRPDESQQWARMMALWALHRIGSAQLDRLLAEAERDERPYLSGYAAKVRIGDIDS